jgi:hypothetical protein
LTYRDFLVAKYLYHIRLSRAVEADAVEAVTGGLLRLFRSTDAPEVSGHDLKVTTPMEPPEAKDALERFCVIYGPGWFASGARELQETMLK